MEHDDLDDAAEMLTHLRTQTAAGMIRVTQHAQQEMFADALSLDDVIAAIETSHLIENYPDHRRGSCCLLSGQTAAGRAVHVVCTTHHPVVVIITVYEPVPPTWITPTQRRSV